MKNIIYKTFIFIGLLSFSNCSSTHEEIYKARTIENSVFKDYWFNNEAELTRYELHQSRYGEIHDGDAILIFVTEDFFVTKQVKYERGNYTDVTPVLKLNFQRDFNTGIYPYHTMTSVFTPLYKKDQKTLKVTASFQEWCGSVFHQINLKGNQYRVELNSYFQNEGDSVNYVENTLLEDEVWTKIRINPDSIPSGNVKIIPGTTFLRFRHIPLKSESANIIIDEITDIRFSPGLIKQLTLSYTTIERRLIIYFEKDFPYSILGWEETYPGGFGEDTKPLTTTGIRTHSIKLNYWNHNKKNDASLRELLGLEI